jgi:hypothetical protein
MKKRNKIAILLFCIFGGFLLAVFFLFTSIVSYNELDYLKSKRVDENRIDIVGAWDAPGQLFGLCSATHRLDGNKLTLKLASGPPYFGGRIFQVIINEKSSEIASVLLDEGNGNTKEIEFDDGPYSDKTQEVAARIISKRKK